MKKILFTLTLCGLFTFSYAQESQEGTFDLQKSIDQFLGKINKSLEPAKQIKLDNSQLDELKSSYAELNEKNLSVLNENFEKMNKEEGRELTDFELADAQQSIKAEAHKMAMNEWKAKFNSILSEDQMAIMKAQKTQMKAQRKAEKTNADKK